MARTLLALHVVAATAFGMLPLGGCSSSSNDAAHHGTNAGASTGGTLAGAGSGTTAGSGGANGGASGAAAGIGNGGTEPGGRGGTTSSAAGKAAGGRSANGGKAGSSTSAGRGGGKAGSGMSAGAAGSAGETSTTGWLYTKGNQISVSDGNGGGTPWMGRGVNMDDIFLCGFNGSLSLASPGDTVSTLADNLITGWKPNFIRISLAMATNAKTVSWFTDTTTYAQPMTDVIRAIGKHENVYVLVTVRSDSSMIGQDQVHGDPEATGIPSDSSTTPDKTAFPRGTDPLYEALVDTFANDAFVLFGLTNEPGGNQLSPDQIKAAMDHAVSTIRAEEDKLGVPHHLVSVQGNNWTSDISFYHNAPLTQDNVVYEVHGYPPSSDSYTYSDLPVILGEYGSLDSGSAPAFFADVEKKQVPNLAWDFDPYSNCQPDLVNVDQSPSNLTPTDWGTLVKNYLATNAQ
jgi:hypothetical protein